MNKTVSTILIVTAILVLAGVFFLAGSMYSRFNTFGPGMMNGFGRNNYTGYGMGPGMTLAPGASAGVGGYGLNNRNNSALTPLTVDQARQAAQKYIQALNVQGLEIAEVMIFDNNAYVAVKESDTGLGAFELLVDPNSQVAYPEYGPNMMWNLKYGWLNHGSMMGGYGGMAGGMTLAPGASAGAGGGWRDQSTLPATVSADMPVTKDQAIQYAQAYLDQYQPGAITAEDPIQFYGYYTLDFSRDGKVAGMLSVNGYSGLVFLHTWHGTFVAEAR